MHETRPGIMSSGLAICDICDICDHFILAARARKACTLFLGVLVQPRREKMLRTGSLQTQVHTAMVLRTEQLSTTTVASASSADLQLSALCFASVIHTFGDEVVCLGCHHRCVAVQHALRSKPDGSSRRMFTRDKFRCREVYPQARRGK